MYSYLLKTHCKKQFGISESDFYHKWRMHVNMMVVETVKPFHSQVFRVSEKWLENGHKEWIGLLQRFVFHKQRGFDRLAELDPLQVHVL